MDFSTIHHEKIKQYRNTLFEHYRTIVEWSGCALCGFVTAQDQIFKSLFVKSNDQGRHLVLVSNHQRDTVINLPDMFSVEYICYITFSLAS